MTLFAWLYVKVVILPTSGNQRNSKSDKLPNFYFKSDFNGSFL